MTASLAAQSLLSQAEQAHARGELDREQKLLQAAAGSEGGRAQAERRLAWIAWRFYHDYDSARAHFDRAGAFSATLAGRAQMETARKRFDEARAFARRAMETADNGPDRQEAVSALASAVIEEAFETGRSSSAAEALELVTALVRAEPGRFATSRQMYGLALLCGDGARATEALRSYYWGGKTFPLYPEAGLAGKPAEVVQYSRFCRRVAEIANENYRLRALGQSQGEVLEGQLLAEARKSYPDLATKSVLFDALSRRFSAQIGVFRWGLEYGHRIFDEDVSYDQYGHKGTVRGVVVDSMISNGYISWYSGGKEIIGGWADNPIIRVRNDNALRAWLSVSDAARRAEFDASIAKASAEDEAIARRDPHAFLEGLMLRMARRANRDVLANVQARELAGGDLRLAYLAEWQRQEDACVYAHEARHLIDPRSAPFNREMTAALSRVIFGGYPAAGLRGILAPNIGRRDSGSGEGNWYIMQGIVAWMEKHAGEIKGFDKSRPVLPQFDLLTDAQIRQAFLSMDPLAR